MKSQYQNKIFYNKVDILALNLRLNVGDFYNNSIILELKVVTLRGNHSYTLKHYYLLIDTEA